MNENLYRLIGNFCNSPLFMTPSASSLFFKIWKPTEEKIMLSSALETLGSFIATNGVSVTQSTIIFVWRIKKIGEFYTTVCSQGSCKNISNEGPSHSMLENSQRPSIFLLPQESMICEVLLTIKFLQMIPHIAWKLSFLIYAFSMLNQ